MNNNNNNNKLKYLHFIKESRTEREMTPNTNLNKIILKRGQWNYETEMDDA